MDKKVSGESVVKDIRRRTRKKYSSEEKIRIVIDGLRGEDSISNLCRREGIPTNLYYRWSKDFLEAGKKKRLMGDTTREASSHEVVDLKFEMLRNKVSLREIAKSVSNEGISITHTAVGNLRENAGI
jgi:transposase